LTQAGDVGDWQKAYSEDVVNNPIRNACAAALAEEAVKRQRRVILFAEQIHHLNVLSQRLQTTPHEVMSGVHASKDERLDACKQMNEGDLRLIITNRVFGKGVDVPAADFSIDATGGSSLNNTIQRLGRLSRTKEGKQGFVHVDLVDKSPTSDKSSVLYNRFGVAARRRLKALRSLGLPIINLNWSGNAVEILDRADKLLMSTLSLKNIV